MIFSKSKFFRTSFLFFIIIINYIDLFSTASRKNICPNVTSSEIVWSLVSLKCPYWTSDILWVLYDVKNGEGFYLQRSVFDRTALLTAILNQNILEHAISNTVSLVLYPFCNVSHWSYEKNRRLPWSLFYNIKQNQVLIFEYDILKLLIGNKEFKVDLIGLNFDYKNNNKEKDTSIEFFNEEEILNNRFNNSKCDLGKFFKGEKPIYSGHCEYIQTNNVYCFNYYKLMRPKEISDTIYELFTLRKNDKKLFLFLLKHADNILVPWPWELDQFGIIDTLQHSNYIIKKYKNYILKNKLFFTGDPYLSLHLRRNDFVIIRRNEIPSFRQVLERSLQLSRELGINRILISTDGNKEEKSKLMTMFKSSGLILHIIDANYEKEDGIISAISQIVLLNGEYFIGTKESRFSLSVSWECTLRERYKKKIGMNYNFNRCNEYFCENQSICREHKDRLPK
ncbi:hypothetical protein FG386_002921 [Cryptosporidium ryanae]|uniref:uncharacterized protein n=1 Tax=Cryptosporidium ryanae TaxID=515981 RepID=UPI00351A180F|nr:hypothetical protein FG386_002921 [Cryptosporidium ryanae]